MAERRMFAKAIIESDAFIDLSPQAQALYIHLCMDADDDGFINSPKRITRAVGASDGDLQELLSKRFVILFESGVAVIKHWKIHNYIQKDRYKKTTYLEELDHLEVKTNKAYTLKDSTLDTECIQDVSNLDSQVRLGKVRLDKNKKHIPDKSGNAPTKKIYGEYKHVRLSDDDFEKLKNEYGEEMTRSCITYLDEYIEMKGYKAQNHYLCIRKWVVKAVKEKTPKNNWDINSDGYSDLIKMMEG